MILLDIENKIVYDALIERMNAPEGEYTAVDFTIADFDGVTLHVGSDAEQKNLITVSAAIKCFSALTQYGATEYLQEKYGSMLVSPAANYDVSVQVDLTKLPADKVALAKSVAMLKRNCFAAPYYKAFADIEAKKPGAMMEINYRDDEAVFIKPEADGRCTVVFNVAFRDKDDVVLAKVFLQEYQDARRTMQNVPSVQYSQKEPPLELKDAKSLRVTDSNGFVTFVLFASHMTPGKRDKTIDTIHTFRNYLHYHLKCSKAHIHARMRNRVRLFLQVLNRARSELQDPSTAKKTIAGKTFVRADDPQTGGDELVGGV